MCIRACILGITAYYGILYLVSIEEKYKLVAPVIAQASGSNCTV